MRRRQKALKEAGITKLPNLYALKTEYKKLDAERERLSAQYSEAKQKLKEYGIVKQNVDSILRTAPGKGAYAGTMNIPRMNYPPIPQGPQAHP